MCKHKTIAFQVLSQVFKCPEKHLNVFTFCSPASSSVCYILREYKPVRHSSQSTSLWFQRCGHEFLLHSCTKICGCSIQVYTAFSFSEDTCQTNKMSPLSRLWNSVMEEDVQLPWCPVAPAVCAPGYQCLRTRASILLYSLETTTWLAISALTTPLATTACCILRPPFPCTNEMLKVLL